MRVLGRSTTVFTGSYSTATSINNSWSGGVEAPAQLCFNLTSADCLASAWGCQAGVLVYLRPFRALCRCTDEKSDRKCALPSVDATSVEKIQPGRSSRCGSAWPRNFLHLLVLGVSKVVPCHILFCRLLRQLIDTLLFLLDLSLPLFHQSELTDKFPNNLSNPWRAQVLQGFFLNYEN